MRGRQICVIRLSHNPPASSRSDNRSAACADLSAQDLALRPAHSRCHQFVTCISRRLQPFRYLHSRSGSFRLEHLPGGPCTHWKTPPLRGAHPLQALANGSSRGTTFATHWLGMSCGMRAIPRLLALVKQLARGMGGPPFPCQNSCRRAEKSSRDYIAEKVPGPNEQ